MPLYNTDQATGALTKVDVEPARLSPYKFTGALEGVEMYAADKFDINLLADCREKEYLKKDIDNLQRKIDLLDHAKRNFEIGMKGAESALNNLRLGIDGLKLDIRLKESAINKQLEGAAIISLRDKATGNIQEILVRGVDGCRTVQQIQEAINHGLGEAEFALTPYCNGDVGHRLKHIEIVQGDNITQITGESGLIPIQPKIKGEPGLPIVQTRRAGWHDGDWYNEGQEVLDKALLAKFLTAAATSVNSRTPNEDLSFGVSSQFSPSEIAEARSNLEKMRQATAITQIREHVLRALSPAEDGIDLDCEKIAAIRGNQRTLPDRELTDDMRADGLRRLHGFIRKYEASDFVGKFTMGSDNYRDAKQTYPRLLRAYIGSKQEDVARVCGDIDSPAEALQDEKNKTLALIDRIYSSDGLDDIEAIARDPFEENNDAPAIRASCLGM